MPYYGDGAPYYYGGAFSNHSSLMTGISRYHNPIAARYSPHLSTISESPIIVLRRYSPAATATTSVTTSLTRPRRIIDTADIDVSKPPRSLGQDRHQHQQQRHRLRRDRPTIKIRSQALKDNPALREYNEKHEKTVGELLVEKFLIKDKQSEPEGQRKMKLYHQASLATSDDRSPLAKERENDILAAIRRRVTRRMTRRRSSADVVPLDPEQIEREAAFHAAQAEALDSLVAEEQAEIEVEMRRGTFAKRQAMRLPVEISEVSETEDENEVDGAERKHPTAKKKRRKKVTPSPPPPPPPKSDLDDEDEEDDDEDELDIPESVIEEEEEEEEEFEWDDREKCDDIKKVVPVEEVKRIGKDIARTVKSEVNLDKVQTDVVKPKETPVIVDAVPEKDTNKVQKEVKKEPEIAKVESKDKTSKVDTKLKEPKKAEAKIDKAKIKETKTDQTKKSEQHNRLKRTTSAPQNKVAESNDTPPRFKVEACNSVGDFSTLYVKAGVPVPPSQSAIKTIEQFRESIRLPAPRRPPAGDADATPRPPSSIETEVVLPVRKPYVRDTSRNSVYLALKPSQTQPQIHQLAEPEGPLGADDDIGSGGGIDGLSIIIDEKRKESEGGAGVAASPIDSSRPGKSAGAPSKVESGGDSIIIKEGWPGTEISADQTATVVPIAVDDADRSRAEPIETEVLPERTFRRVAQRPKQEFTAWWDEIEEDAELDKKRADNKVVDVTEKLDEKIVESKKSEEATTKVKSEKEIIDSTDKVKDKGESTVLKSEVEATPKTDLDKKIPSKVAAKSEIGIATKTKVDGKIGDLADKNKEKVEVAPVDEKAKNKVEATPKVELDKKTTSKIGTKSDSGVAAKAKLESKVRISPEKIKDKVEAVSVDEKPKSKVEAVPKVDSDKKTDKLKPSVVEVTNKGAIKTTIDEAKEKSSDKVADAKEKSATKSASEKEVRPDEQLKKTDAQKKAQAVPKVSAETGTEKLTSAATEIASPIGRDEPISSPAIIEKKLVNSDTTKPRSEYPRLDRHLSNIPEEPKSPSPTEKQQTKPFAKTNDITSHDVKPTPITRTVDAVPKKAEPQPKLIKPNLATPTVAAKREKDDRKKRVDAEAVMKIEKKILEDAESPRKILTTAIPETQLIEASASLTPPVAVTALATKKEENKEELQPTEPQPQAEVEKVGLPATKKKSAETARGTEIDFWSEIKDQESAKVSGTPKKAQSRVDSPPVDQLINEVPLKVDNSELLTKKSPESLKLDLSKIVTPTAAEEQEDLKTPLVPDQEDSKTPLVPDQEDQRTPIILEPSTPLAENLSKVPLINLELTEENRSSVIYNGIGVEVQQQDKEKTEEEEQRTSIKEAELSGTVKKISKWTAHNNLSKLNEADKDTTPVASKEVSPQASTTTKKKVVKRKKSTTGTTGTKKKSEKADGSAKTSAKTKGPLKKVAAGAVASPQTSLLKAPMSATGSPRNSPNQRPADLMKLFYTTPAILLTATPRDLRKVRRAKVKRKKPTTRTPSLSSDSTGSTRSTATTSTEEGSNCEEDAEHKRLASTRSNDSGFDGSPRLSSPAYMRAGRKSFVRRRLRPYGYVDPQHQAAAPSQSSENQRNADGDHFHHSGRITPPATNLPRFKKYEVTDFNFLKVLGKGSFGKVLLAELRGTECVYAVKCLKKDVVLEDDDVECTLIERKVLTLATRHPYLCHLFCTFQTESHLFFVMEYLNGGDLMFHIQKSGRFSEPRAKFYAAEIWSGLIFLHKKGIVYRDLKLDNVLLDFEGHIRIADFGMCKLQIFLDRTADTFCGTPDYMAPEIIKGLKYNQAVDWWSFGVLLYEMLTGQSPFSGCDEDELFWSICNERPFIPRYLSQSSTDILVCLLEKDAGKRIPGHEIACHPFFCTIAWDKLERRSLEAPFKPAVEHTLDTRYFDTAFTTERPRLTPVPEQILTSMDQAVFRGFSYTNPNATD